MSTKNTGQSILWLLSLAVAATCTHRYPVILVPGMWGSRIQAKLNKPNTVHFICTKISNGYDIIWMNSLSLGPYTIDCMVDNMRLEYDNVSRTTQSPPGVNTKVPGWGHSNTVEHIDPGLSDFGKYFNTISDMLVDFGLVRDISLRAAPYDFRKAPNENNEFFDNLKMLTEDTYTMNNRKPVIFIAHGLGGSMLLLFLQRQTQEWKDQYVRLFVSLAVAWGGSVNALKTFVEGYNLGFKIVNAKVVKAMVITFPSLPLCLPSQYFWNKNEVLIESGTKTFTRDGNYKSFFESIDYKTGYEMYLDVKQYINLEPPGVEVYCLHGVGVPTVDKMTYGPDLKNNLNNTFGDGDGSSNIRSLKACIYWSGIQKEAVVHKVFPNVDGQSILSDPNVMDYIFQIMNTH